MKKVYPVSTDPLRNSGQIEMGFSKTKSSFNFMISPCISVIKEAFEEFREFMKVELLVTSNFI